MTATVHTFESGEAQDRIASKVLWSEHNHTPRPCCIQAILGALGIPDDQPVTVVHGRLEPFGMGSPWKLDPWVEGHLRDCDGCSASIHLSAFPLYRIVSAPTETEKKK